MTIRMRNLSVTLLLLVLTACGGQPAERPKLAKTGLPAPELSLKKIINAPAEVKEIGSWRDLEGKAVVLEFWATWCDPCVESIPHMNQLAQRFSGRPVVFLSVTDESEADVRAFLKDHRMDSWIAPEAGAGIFKAFRVYGRPHTVLIGRDGKVAAFSYPAEVTEARVMELLANKATEVEAQGVDAAGAPAEPLAEFYMVRSTSPSGSADYSDGHMYARGMPLKYALAYLLGGIDKFEVKPGAAGAMSGSYDIRLSVPPERAGMKRELFLKGLETGLGLKVKESFDEADVLVLKIAPGGPINVAESREYADIRVKGMVIEAAGSGFSVLAQTLSESMREPVLDETKNKKIYKFTFDRGDDNPRVISAQLQKQLGLRLERLRRKIHVLEISPVKTLK